MTPTRDPVARAIGNLAGVVEWANDAFATLSGVPLAETVDKPVRRLLERAGIGLDVVELVAQQFFEGQVCRIAFPFDRPDGRRIEVVLDVTALHDEEGEVDRFLAEVRERVDAGPGGTEAGDAGAGARRPKTPATSGRRIDRPLRSEARSDLSRVVAACFARPRAAEGRGASTSGAAPDRVLCPRPDPRLESRLDVRFDAGLGSQLDFDLDATLPPIAAPRDALEALLAALTGAARFAIDEAANAGAVITLSTAVARPFRRIVSKVHPIASGPPEPIDRARVVLEIHDTGLPLASDALERLRRAESKSASGPAPACSRASDPRSEPASRRESLLHEALAIARPLGARLRFDATPGCGNQVLVLFPAAPDDSVAIGSPALAE